MVSEAQARYPELRACSFDRGFHSPDNRIKLDALLDLNVLPRKGYLSRADREREAEEPFAAARRAHPAIESAINGLEHRGLARRRLRAHRARREAPHPWKLNVLPRKGYLSRADREREAEEPFAAARRAHPAIESAINGLEHRGLDRVRSHGADGFARTVALSVLAAKLHRIGLLLQKRERTTTTRRLTGRFPSKACRDPTRGKTGSPPSLEAGRPG